MNPYNGLAARIRTELADINRAVDEAERLMEKADTNQDEDYLGTAALSLHGFYGGAEALFEMIARDMDKSVPSGAKWHRELLMQMAGNLHGIRPPVISHATRWCLDDFRAFRHRIRNIYVFEIRHPDVRRLIRAARPCLQSLQQDLEAFAAFLEQLNDEPAAK